MVNSVTNPGKSGLSDWLLQRVSAVILGVYCVALLVYLLMNPSLDYEQWQALFASNWMRIASLLALLSICVHSWVGMWIVATDYLTPLSLGRAATTVRLLFEVGCVILIFIYLVWGILILWGS